MCSELLKAPNRSDGINLLRRHFSWRYTIQVAQDHWEVVSQRFHAFSLVSFCNRPRWSARPYLYIMLESVFKWITWITLIFLYRNRTLKLDFTLINLMLRFLMVLSQCPLSTKVVLPSGDFHSWNDLSPFHSVSPYVYQWISHSL